MTQTEPFVTLQLLARGILELYRDVDHGYIVGYNDPLQGHHTPDALRKAMTQLGRAYLTEGSPDQAASIHLLLRQCTTPLDTWAPRSLASLPDYRRTILIDPTYLVPSEDCDEIAAAAGGSHLDDLLERRWHAALMTTLQVQGAAAADAAYTRVREFIGRRPMTSRAELAAIAQDPELPYEVGAWLTSIYRRAHRSEAREGLVPRCGWCQGKGSLEGHCTLAGCRADHPDAKPTEPLAVAEAWIAQDALLKYWADPAREELRIYDELRAEPALGDHVTLYPHQDRCDVGIVEEVGIDVKDYQDPFRLADRFNRSLGGLSHYPRRILAIAQRQWDAAYRDQLLDRLSNERRSQLEVLSVNQTISWAKRWAKREGPHA